jgi:integrase
MGQHLMRRAPKYVHGFVDRHGKPRFYFRRLGFKKVPLPGLPWSPEFMAAYQEALAGQRPSIGADKVIPGTMRALAILYYGSLAFRSLKPITQSTYRNIIDRSCRDTDKTGQPFGDKPAALMRREHVVKLMAARAAKPDSANGLRKVLKAIMAHAVELGLRADDPTREVRAIRVKTEGYHSWTEDEIAAFEARHAIGTRPRLALALLLYTGQRRSDVIRMGRQHVREGFLHVRQQKTGVELAIPVVQDLTRVLDGSVTGNLTYLVTEQGKPFTPAGFGNWFREQCDAAGLPKCTAHGLRKAAARRLAEAGCTPHEIAAITGHRSLREIARYTEAANQKQLASVAMAKTKSRTRSG